MNKQTEQALNRLVKWRSVFAGWQLGTRSSEDSESQAVRDHREVTILLRCELNAMLGLLVDFGVLTSEEWEARLISEAAWMEEQFERRFPGAKATDHGMELDAKVFAQTTKGWRP